MVLFACKHWNFWFNQLNISELVTDMLGLLNQEERNCIIPICKYQSPCSSKQCMLMVSNFYWQNSKTIIRDRPLIASNDRTVTETPHFYFDTFLGNEVLLDPSGFYLGSNIILNNGTMSSSNGPGKGTSKAICLAFGWMVFQVPTNVPMNWTGAWTPLDMEHLPTNRIPILYSMCYGCDNYFWVSFIHCISSYP